MPRRRKVALLVLAVAAALYVSSRTRFSIWPFGSKWVRVVRDNGEPVWNAVVILERPGEGESDFQQETEASGWIDIPRAAIRRGQEMVVVAAGCGIVRGRLPLLYKVELPPAVPVTLRLEGDDELPAPPESLSLEVLPAGVREGLEFAFQTAVAPADYWRLGELERVPVPRWFDIDPATRTVDILVPYAGRWQLRWSVLVTRRGAGSVSRSGTGSDEEIPIDVPAGGGTVAFAIDPADIRRFRPR